MLYSQVSELPTAFMLIGAVTWHVGIIHQCILKLPVYLMAQGTVNLFCDKNIEEAILFYIYGESDIRMLVVEKVRWLTHQKF